MTLKLNGSSAGSVSIDAPADTSPSGTDVTLTLPVNDGDSGQYLQTDGSGALSWATVTVPTNGLNEGTLGSAPASTISFESLPSGTDRIIIAVDRMSTTSTERVILELGDSGGYETSGYEAWAKTMGGSGFSTGASLTSAFDVSATIAAGEFYSGILELMRVTDNQWVLNGNLQGSNDNRKLSGGRKSLSAELDRVRLNTTGTSTFDGGEFQIYWFLAS
jgi:hypothetical protein